MLSSVALSLRLSVDTRSLLEVTIFVFCFHPASSFLAELSLGAGFGLGSAQDIKIKIPSLCGPFYPPSLLPFQHVG
ncbi:hypothetical protein EDB86DRAFT_2973606 [Lactarius hatsudake]|nr:hypothetical protein EDB86DRAFT_2973606 [Lactarius hatsudake]